MNTLYHLHPITQDIQEPEAVLAQNFLRLCFCALRRPLVRRALRVPISEYPIFILINFPLPWGFERVPFGDSPLGAWRPHVRRNLEGRRRTLRKLVRWRQKVRRGLAHLRKR